MLPRNFISNICKGLSFSLALVLMCASVQSQDFSNKGKDFWIGYGNHVRMFDPRLIPPTTTCYQSGNAQNCPEKMQVYITSDINTSGLIEIASIGFSQAYTVTANQITTIDIPRSAALADEGLYNTGIHVTSVAPVVVYSFIYVSAISGATLCLPTNVLGKDYYSINYDQLSNEANSYSYFFVVATEDNTTVEITPTQTTKGKRPANQTFTVPLNKGQIYQVLATGDLTGSIIKSVSTATSGCKKIGVFCGSGKISIGCTNSPGSSDNLYQQVYPTSTWGKKFLTAPSTNNITVSNFQTNFFRIIRPDASATVKLNGSTLPSSYFTNGFYYQFSSNSTNYIESDKPILVVQYFTTSSNPSNCGNSGLGDPEMIYLNPVEQTISSVTLNSMQPSSGTNISIHFINIVVKNSGSAINSFRIDGVSYASSFQVFAQDPNYSYARINVPSGTHNLYCDSGFNAIAYGFGAAESYGYSAGTNIRDLYQFVTLQNQYATTNFPATCRSIPFKFSITLPYEPTSLTWDFGNNPNLSPNTTVVNNVPVRDSIFTRDGKTLYVYILPSLYRFTLAGIYPVKVIANNTTSDGCSGVQEINFDVNVFDPPLVNFSIANNGCLSDSMSFSDSTNGNPRPVTRWKWDFGDNTSDSVKNPLKTYTNPGSYNVKLRAITDVGCVADTTKIISISPRPIARFGVTGTPCINSNLSFSDTSTVSSGTIVKWYWDFGNGKSLVSTNNSAQTSTYSNVGTYTVSLQVETSTGCKSTVYGKQIVIHLNPIVKFSLPIVCLPAGAAQFMDSSTIADGTAAAFSYQWQFGDNVVSTIKNPTHTYASAGPFSVKLSVTSAVGCISDTTEQLTSIYPQAKSNFSVLPEVCLRDTTRFRDQSNGSGNTIIGWRWNFGDNKTDTVQNPSHKYTTAGTFKASLFTITDKGCVSDTFSVSTVVNPLPVSDFSLSFPLCAAKDVTITDKSVANAGSINNWFWNFGDNTTISYINANPFNKKYDTAGTYTIKTSVKTDKGCKSDTLTKVITINFVPVVNFTMPQVCLADALAQFKDSTTLANSVINNASYLWGFGDTNASTGNPNSSVAKNPSHKYTATGFYNVSLAVTSNNGCTASAVKQFTVNGSVPISSFTVLKSSALCSNTAVQIQNTSTVDFGGITKVEIIWDALNAPASVVTDSFPVFNKIYSHNYPVLQNTKTYQVKFRAFSGISCANESIKTITINASPAVTFAIIPGICFDATARQITQASGGVVTGSGVYSGNGVSPSGLFTPAIAGVGTHSIHYLYTSDQGCKDSLDKTITVWPSPTAQWSYSSPTCVSNAITFTDSSVANFSKIIVWNWNFGDSTTATYNTSKSFPKTYSAIGSYAVTLQVKTDSGCLSVPVKQIVVINPLPTINFSLPNVCLPNGQATFNNLSTISDNTQSQFSYLWNFSDPNDPSTSVQQNGVHRYSTTGPFKVKLIVTSSNGCIDSSSKMLTTVYPQPKADFTVSPADSCLGGTFDFTDKSNGLTGSVTAWQWNFADGTSSTLQNPARKFTAAGKYDVALFITNQQGCISDTAIKTVNVYAYPSVNAGPDMFILEGGNSLLNASAVGTNLKYNWTPATYLDNTVVLKPITTPLDDITYRLTVIGIGGCSNYDEVFIKVLKSPTIPNAFSPNGDGINDVWIIKYLQSYPGSTVEVFNRYGAVVFRSNGYATPWDGTMNGSPLPVGTYYYIINPKNGRKPYTGNVTILR
ncbi:MAG: PKD domain-containing protein [Bacteroidota bacterium]|nr:PKD domain-containing protein [Bacteroidota bacterium]